MISLSVKVIHRINTNQLLKTSVNQEKLELSKEIVISYFKLFVKKYKTRVMFA